MKEAMKVTRENIGQMIELMMKAARFNREKCGYSEEKEGFMPVAIIMSDDGKIQVAATPHGSNEEKHAVMQAVAYHAAQVHSPLVVLVADTRICNPPEFCRMYGIPEPDAMNKEAFSEAYREVIQRHGGSLGNCHPSTWHDALIVISKSPLVPIQMRNLPYKEGVGDTIIWEKEQVIEHGDGTNELYLMMLPDWWNEPPATIN